MIGLEYILSLYSMRREELANNLNLSKQNINLWLKEEQNIPIKYLPMLSRIFGISKEYFQKNITEVDKAIIQKEKLKKELNDQINRYEVYLKKGENHNNNSNVNNMKILDEFIDELNVLLDRYKT